MIRRKALPKSTLDVLRQETRQLDSEFSSLQKLYQTAHATKSLHQPSLSHRSSPWYLDQADPVEDLDVRLVAGLLQQLLDDLPNDSDSVTRYRYIFGVRVRAIGGKCDERVLRVVGVGGVSLFRGRECTSDDQQAEGEATTLPSAPRRVPEPVHGIDCTTSILIAVEVAVNGPSTRITKRSDISIRLDDFAISRANTRLEIREDPAEPTAEVRVVHPASLQISFI